MKDTPNSIVMSKQTVIVKCHTSFNFYKIYKCGQACTQ